MRSLRIFLLHFEQVFEYRARIFVWFLVAFFNPFLYIIFWLGAFETRKEIASGWTFSVLASYYFLLPIISAFLTCHQEEDIAKLDIQEGGLVKYLMKPISYFRIKLFEEVPWRLMQGGYAVLVVGILFLIFYRFLDIQFTSENILLTLIVLILAFLLSFTFKMIVGIIAFWLIEIHGLFQLVEIIMAIFAGYIMPIEIFPHAVAQVAYILPFSYMIYFPAIAIQGRLASVDYISIIATQIIWLCILIFVYKVMWNKGVKKFSAVGQ